MDYLLFTESHNLSKGAPMGLMIYVCVGAFNVVFWMAWFKCSAVESRLQRGQWGTS